MPPKIQPRRQPPRGAAKGKVDEEVPKITSTKENLVDDNSTQSVLTGLDPPGALENPTTLNVASLPSPNVSSASSPPRRSAQRLASLHSRGTTTPVSNPNTPEVSGTRLKIQPKSSLRRSKETREALEKAEIERRQSRIAKENNPNSSLGSRGGPTGRGRGRGGRGLFSENRFGSDRFASGQATGHLGGGTVGEGANQKKKNVRGALLSGTARTSTQAISASTKAISDRTKKEIAVKSEKDKDGDVMMGSSSAKKLPAIKQEDYGMAYVSSDEEPDMVEGPRINIEHINLISDEDTEEETASPSNKADGNGLHKESKIPNWSLKPIRVDRHAHVDRTIGVNTDASSLTSAELRRKAKERGDAEGSLFLDGEEDPRAIKLEKSSGRRKPKDVEFLRNTRRWKGVWQDSEDEVDEPEIKDEPKDHEEPMIIDSMDQPSTSSRPHALNMNSSISEAAAEKAPEDLTTHPQQIKRGQETWSRLKKPIFRNKEHHEEWARYEENLKFLWAQLGPASKDPVRPPTTPVVGEDGDVKGDDHVEAPKDKKEGLVYIFQVPPIVPGLITLAEKEARTKMQEEKEAQSTTNTKGKTTSDSDPDDTLVNAFTAINLACPVGKIGKMRVYDTGRVMIDWGGASMELDRGIGRNTLQEVVLTDFDRTMVKVEEDGNKAKSGSRGGGGIQEGGQEKEKWEEKIDLGSKGWAVGELAGGDAGGGSFVMKADLDRMLGH